MGGLIVAAALAVYVGGWFAAVVWFARFAAASNRMGGYCHKEARDGFPYRWSWSTRSLCERECRPGCWRRDDTSITASIMAVSCAVALLWPVLWLPLLAFFVAVRPPAAAVSAAHIAELERELGIGSPS